jgi:serine/threonine-protein kinase RsbT
MASENRTMISVEKKVEVPLRREEDVVSARLEVRSLALQIGLNLVEQTKIVTAASELARNAIVYGGGGGATLEIVQNGTRRGLRLTFADEGPGIPDIERAMQDGFTTGGGLGMGLGGAKRLASEFSIDSRPGAGTRVTIIRWKG